MWNCYIIAIILLFAADAREYQEQSKKDDKERKTEFNSGENKHAKNPGNTSNKTGMHSMDLVTTQMPFLKDQMFKNGSSDYGTLDVPDAY